MRAKVVRALSQSERADRTAHGALRSVDWPGSIVEPQTGRLESLGSPGGRVRKVVRAAHSAQRTQLSPVTGRSFV